MTVRRCRHIDARTFQHCPSFAIRAHYCDDHKAAHTEGSAETVVGPSEVAEVKEAEKIGTTWRHTCQALGLDESLYKRNIITIDPARLQQFYESLKAACPDEGILGHVRAQFLNERFLFHSHQAHRLLGVDDLATLEWLRGLYCAASPSAQPLPFPQSPLGFWKHVVQVERTLANVNLAWALPEDTPKLILGFMSRQEAGQLLMPQKVGTFFLRISNAEVGSIVLCVKGPKGVRQESIKASTVAALCSALDAAADAEWLLPTDVGATAGLHKSKLMELLLDERFVVARNNEYEEIVFARVFI